MNRMNISFTSVVRPLLSDEEKTQIKTKCSYLITDKAKYIQYDESVDGCKTRCRVTVEGDTITVLRKGEAVSKMVFRKGEKTDFSYIMPFGYIDMTVITDKLFCSIDNFGGDIELDYRIFSSGEKVSDNKIVIKLS